MYSAINSAVLLALSIILLMIQGNYAFPTSQAISARTATTGKRGLIYDSASEANGFVGHGNQITWADNYASSLGGLNTAFEFVPTLYGLTSGETSVWNTNANNAINSGSKHLLSFNEPDQASQSNLSPAAAASGYKAWMQPFGSNAQLGSPAVTNSGLTGQGLQWLQSFLVQCSGCQIDFVAIHWYGTSLTDLQNFINSAYTTGGGKPIWLSEFGYLGGTIAQQNTFLQAAIPSLDGNSQVTRYAYYAAIEGILDTSGQPSDPLGITYYS